MTSSLETQYIIHNKYVITDKIGKGKFGEVYKGRDIQTNETVAVKLEHHAIPKLNPYSKYYTKQNDLHILKHETRILNFLHNRRCKNIPYIYWFGIQSNIPALVMPYYEYSLFDLFTQTANKHAKHTHSVNDSITQNTSEWSTPEEIMRSILRILESIHATGVVHRDIKPHNFMIKNRELILIDFGMATFYVDQNSRHIKEPEIPKEHLLGTPKYISINVHCGKEYTRRDDLISTGYLYLFLRHWFFWDTVIIPTDIVDQNTIRIQDQFPHKTPNVVSTGIAQFPHKTPNVVSTGIAQYPETHISHPKNNAFRMAKELSNIEKCLMDYTDKNDTTRRMILTYLHYVYALGFDEIPNYDVMINVFTKRTTSSVFDILIKKKGVSS
jgi:serine/threonine protein kinase